MARTGDEFRPPHNLLNPDSLEWVLGAIRHPLFGEHRFPGLPEKAAALAWQIIRGHVFYSACKRTGMAACLYILRLNSRTLDVTEDELVEVALRIAEEGGNGFTREMLTRWIRQNLRRVQRP